MNEEQHRGHWVLFRLSKEKREKELREDSDFIGCYQLWESMILILNMKAKLRRISSRSIAHFKTVISA